MFPLHRHTDEMVEDMKEAEDEVEIVAVVEGLPEGAEAEEVAEAVVGEADKVAVLQMLDGGFHRMTGNPCQKKIKKSYAMKEADLLQSAN